MEPYIYVTGPIIVEDTENKRHKFLIDRKDMATKNTFHDLKELEEFLEHRWRIRKWIMNKKV